MKPTANRAPEPSSLDRILAALEGRGIGRRPPAGNPTSIACHDLMDACGASFPGAHTDPHAMADLAAAGHEIVGFDTVMPEFSVHQESAALGCEVDWGSRDSMPVATTRPYEDFSEIDVPGDLLEKPSMRVVLDALSILRRGFGGRVAVVGKVMGPWTLSYHLAGVENFLLQVGRRDKGRVEGMLRRLMPVTIAFARAQFEAGADVVVLADHATGDLVGPYHYEEHLLPIHREITAEIEGPLILHVCGDCADRIELFAGAGFDAYHFESAVDARLAVEKAGGRMALVGNVNNPETLLRGGPDDVRREVRRAVEAGVHVIAPECAVPLRTPLANLKAVVEAAREG